MCPGLCNTYYIYIFIIYDCNQLHGSFLFLRIKIHNIYYIYIYIYIYIIGRHKRYNIKYK